MARHLWPSLAISRIKGDPGAAELAGEILIERALEPESPGVCLFRMRHLMDPDSPLADRLLDELFTDRSLIPESPSLESKRPARPKVTIKNDGVTFQPGEEDDVVRHWIVQSKSKTRWTTEILPGRSSRWEWPVRPSQVAVRAAGRSRTLGPPKVISFPNAESPPRP